MENEKKQPEKTEEELAVYEKLRLKLSKGLSEFNEKLGKESIGKAMDKAMAELREMGGFSKEAIARAGETLKKDIASTTVHIRPRVDKVTTPAKDQFDHWLNKGGALWQEIANETAFVRELSRDKSGAFLLNITRALSEWSGGITEKLDTSLQYKSGEITHGGEFVCLSCEGRIQLKKPGRIPPCPKCSGSDFRRS